MDFFTNEVFWLNLIISMIIAAAIAGVVMALAAFAQFLYGVAKWAYRKYKGYLSNKHVESCLKGPIPVKQCKDNSVERYFHEASENYCLHHDLEMPSKSKVDEVLSDLSAPVRKKRGPYKKRKKPTVSKKKKTTRKKVAKK